jgi:hypothetical protein
LPGKTTKNTHFWQARDIRLTLNPPGLKPKSVEGNFSTGKTFGECYFHIDKAKLDFSK